MKTPPFKRSLKNNFFTLDGRKCLALAAATALIANSTAYASSKVINDAGTTDEEKQKITFSGSGYVGYRHDSNVSVSELDTNSNVDDSAVQSKALLKVSVKPTNEWENELSISRADTRYQTLSEFDLGLTTLSASTKYTLDFAKLGAHYYHASATLDGRDFLTYQQYGLSAGKLLGQRTYLRISSDLIDKKFKNRPEDAPIRDSEAVALRSDLFYFFEGDDFFQIALKYQNEDAQDNAFDYTGKGIDLAYTYPFAVFSKPLKLKVAYQLDMRDYASVQDSGIGREDDRQLIEMSADYAVYDHIDIRLSTQYGDYASSVDGANYQETIAELGINVHF
ncbi:hypothetical protein D1814_08800 [Alteromonas sp. BL110]|uniref:hypothetical protein n=1 Tax=Alteromonas sp. BL110 TaxID=1714845 RepID=UPI000E513371|nr:hypothetical protein [Alteromonas sp. BL110]AXT38766.1 hypothetical protein D1814_08800 [Alteromonas sp. BL110]RKM83084.1 hypothetical protein D7031_03655 [Alteromonas sp. BL110]